MTTQVAVRTDVNLKRLALKKVRYQGLTLSFVINRLLKEYVEEDYEVLLRKKIDAEPEVSTEEIFSAPEIVDAANKLSKYLRNKKL